MAFLITGLGGLLVWRMFRRTSVCLVAGSFVCLLLLAMPLVSNSLLRPLQGEGVDGPAPSPPQAIVVLGGDQSEAVGTAGLFDVGPLSLERERAGAAIARRTGLPVLVTGGRLGRSPLPISEIMARSLVQDFGVRVTWTETTSRTTWENAENSAALLKAQGIGSAYLVTQGWHMPRAVLAFKHFGIAVVPAPTQMHPSPSFRWASLIPTAASWNESYYAMHEWIGWAYYAFRSRTIQRA